MARSLWPSQGTITPESMAIKEEVADAIGEIEATFEGATVSVDEDGDGGAYVIVDPVDPGEPYEQDEGRHTAEFYDGFV